MSTASDTTAIPSASPSRFLSLWRNPVGKKAAMAVTGIVLFLFTLVHMSGNLQVFEGAGALDRYAKLLRISLPFLWFVRAVLLVSLLVHVTAGVDLWLKKRDARAVAYQDHRFNSSSVASRSMMVSGLILLLFVVWHIMDLTLGVPGVAPRGFEDGAVYANVVHSLGRGVVGMGYVAAMIALGFHLWHGLFSVTQSLGLSNRGVVLATRRVAIFFAVVLTVGFSAVPIAVLFGLIS